MPSVNVYFLNFKQGYIESAKRWVISRVISTLVEDNGISHKPCMLFFLLLVCFPSQFCGFSSLELCFKMFALEDHLLACLCFMSCLFFENKHLWSLIPQAYCNRILEGKGHKLMVCLHSRKFEKPEALWKLILSVEWRTLPICYMRSSRKMALAFVYMTLVSWLTLTFWEPWLLVN